MEVMFFIFVFWNKGLGTDIGIFASSSRALDTGLARRRSRKLCVGRLRSRVIIFTYFYYLCGIRGFRPSVIGTLGESLGDQLKREQRFSNQKFRHRREELHVLCDTATRTLQGGKSVIQISKAD